MKQVNVKTVIAAMVMLLVSMNCAEAQKLSKEAIAADPRASVTTVEEGYTKSPAQIRAAYEALNPEVYFKPYYHPNLRNYYLLDDSKAEMEYWEKSCKTVDRYWCKIRDRAALQSNGTIDMGSVIFRVSQNDWYFHFEKETIPAEQHKNWECSGECSGLMPVGASAMRAGFALFAADPEGLKPFMRYCEAFCIYHTFKMNFIHINFGSANQITEDRKRVAINENKDFENLAVSWGIFYDKWKPGSPERTRTLELVKSKTPVKVIQEAATYYRDQMLKNETAKNYSELRYNFHVFEMVMSLWQEFKGGGGEFNSFYSEYKNFANRYEELVKLDYYYAPTVDMPKSYNVDAALTTKALAAAKIFASNQDNSFTVDAVAFIDKDWYVTKNNEWPNHPRERERLIGLLSKEKDGRWMMRYAYLIQMGNNRGSYLEEYNVIYPNNNNNGKYPRAVNYKP